MFQFISALMNKLLLVLSILTEIFFFMNKHLNELFCEYCSGVLTQLILQTISTFSLQQSAANEQKYRFIHFNGFEPLSSQNMSHKVYY